MLAAGHSPYLRGGNNFCSDATVAVITDANYISRLLIAVFTDF